MSQLFLNRRSVICPLLPLTMRMRPLAWAILLAVGLLGGLHAALAAAPPDAAPHFPCGEPPADDPQRPSGFHLYFADEFDCEQLGPHWVQQEMMTAASYVPPASGYVTVADGRLQVGVHEEERSFPYLYLIDDSATTYDLPHSQRRVDWLPPAHQRMRISMRMRFQIEKVGDHRISIYADGHSPSYAGPLFYVGSDYNRDQPSWRGLVLGADEGTSVVTLNRHGFVPPYTDWFVFTVDYFPDEDYMALSINGTIYLIRRLSDFQDAGEAALYPDVLYLGSLARMEKPTSWIDVDMDWLRVYVPESTVPPGTGLLTATVVIPPEPSDAPSLYSQQLPGGPFANTPHWSETFADSNGTMPSYWHLLVNHDPENSRTVVREEEASILSNDQATGVPVWGIVDDILPTTRQPAVQERWDTYRSMRMAQTERQSPAAARIYQYPRVDWRPNTGNVRYAWKARQTADGYGVEVSNGGHFPFFTGALFYTLLDTTANNGQGQFIFPGCQEKYFWELHRLPQFQEMVDRETIVTADYINGTVFLSVDGQQIGWWPESDCSLNWYLQGRNATEPDLLFFGNPAESSPGSWSDVFVDWFATFPEVPRTDRPTALALSVPELHLYMDDAERSEPFTTTLQVQASVAFSDSIRWHARLSTIPTWLTLVRTQGLLNEPTTKTAVLPPVTETVPLAVRRPITHGTHVSILTVEGFTADEQAIQPVQSMIHMHYAPRWHQTFLPALARGAPPTPATDPEEPMEQTKRTLIRR